MSLSPNWNAGGEALAPRQNSKRSLRDILHALTGVTAAEMTATKPQARFPNQPFQLHNGLRYYWHTISVLAADGFLVVAADDAPAAGRFLLSSGQDVEITAAVAFGTADAAVLYTAPTGATLLPRHLWWEVTTDFAGGTSSTVGTSSDAAGSATKGDLLGGAAGDAAAALVAATYADGAIGAALGNPAAIIAAGEIWRYDRITSAFTSGVGTAHMVARVLANAGA